MNATLRVIARYLSAVFLIALLGSCRSDPATQALVEQQSAALRQPEMGLVEPAEASRQPAASPTEPFRTIQIGMSDKEVRDILNAPDSENVGLSGRAFNPFYWGPNQTRATWSYTGKGRIIFDRNMYTGTMRVIRVISNPGE